MTRALYSTPTAASLAIARQSVMKITWYGHSCFRVATGKSVILIDPFLKGNPTFENSGIAWDAATDGVTHVALTHGHDDHLGDAGAICKNTGATLFAVYELAMHVGQKGAQKLEPMNTGGTVFTEDFELTLTQALHSSSSSNVYLGNPCGIVIRAMEGKILYHMGDTDVFAGMALINELYQPEIGIVPIGDRFTMGARSAAFACKKFFHFRTIFPCHYGTFPGLLDATADKFATEMRGHNVVVPKVGEVVTA
jgi:L-ascorbate metabolism protein UlaG (beta-lactamase superfamily)